MAGGLKEAEETARSAAFCTSPTISVCGGLPNPISFPIKEMEQAVQKVLEKNGVQALQYSTTAGYKPLREFIAKRYARLGVEATADDIIITNGSQQALDMFDAGVLRAAVSSA